MQFRITMRQDGTVDVAALEGSFSEASRAVLDLLARAGASGVNITAQGQPEQHRHDPEVSVHGHAHN